MGINLPPHGVRNPKERSPPLGDWGSAGGGSRGGPQHCCWHGASRRIPRAAVLPQHVPSRARGHRGSPSKPAAERRTHGARCRVGGNGQRTRRRRRGDRVHACRGDHHSRRTQAIHAVLSASGEPSHGKARERLSGRAQRLGADSWGYRLHHLYGCADRSDPAQSDVGWQRAKPPPHNTELLQAECPSSKTVHQRAIRLHGAIRNADCGVDWRHGFV
mmetsp:Transcript_12538/g.34081  ORF Transcript_12538/g.34081 Transcript_12538/m.34081 type:complete len:217 (+) Transcript_12538:900-1550(+)